MFNPELLKRHLPGWLRRRMGVVRAYLYRVAMWPIILWQVRGASWRDEAILVISACAAPISSLANLGEWRDPDLLASCTVNVPGIGMFRLRAHCDDLYHVLPWRERSIVRRLREDLRPGDVFIDAGANIGVYTVLAARRVGPEGKVIAVEMIPDTTERLASHIQLNELPNVTLVSLALSHTAGLNVRASVLAGKYGRASIVRSFANPDAVLVEVQTVTLDAIADGLKHVKLMKIDLEGAEFAALQGASEMLDRTEAVIYESWGATRAGLTDVDKCLLACGFSLKKIDGNNWIASRSSRPGTISCS